MKCAVTIRIGRSAHGRRAFSLAELLVVSGVIALLVAIIIPPVQLARRQAMLTKCVANLQQIGHALEDLRSTHGFYPLSDDGGSPTRYTWIDVLIQRELIPEPATYGTGNPTSPNLRPHIAYCPDDRLPDALNSARHPGVLYPLNREVNGVDYSYGIGVPLSSGGWALQGSPRDNGPSRRFIDHEMHASRRVLAADAYAPAVYNLSGQSTRSNVWNDPTQFDNTVAWQRHRQPGPDGIRANFLFQDGHASRRKYDPTNEEMPINTAQTFVWQPGESVFSTPSDLINGYRYPNMSPPHFEGDPPGTVLPNLVVPGWYTKNQHWTLIRHK